MSEPQRKPSSGAGLRIHYLSASTLPSRAANSVHVMKMCEAFARNGCNVTLFARGEGVKPADVFAHYGVKSVFELALTSPGGGRFLRMPMRVNGYRRMMNALPTADLIYGRDVFSLWLLAHRRKRSFVFEAHHPPTSRLQAILLKALMDSPYLKAVVTISERLRHAWLQRFPDLRPERVHVAHDGADCPDTVERIAIPGARDGKAQIGYVGSLYEGRGIEVILALAERLPEVDVHLVGGTRSEIEAWRARGVPINVSFHGHIPHRDIKRWLTSFDLLLAPYQRRVQIGTGLDTVDWMSPLKIFEYMASGRPLVASNLPALREVLVHEGNCLLVEPEDVSGWCDAVTSLLREPAHANRLAQEARTDLVREYSWLNRADMILHSLLQAGGLHEGRHV